MERDQQVQRLGEILQQEMAATDVETGATPRIEDLVDRVRHMQDAVASIVASHFEETSPSSKRAQPSKSGKDDDQVPKKVLKMMPSLPKIGGSSAAPAKKKATPTPARRTPSRRR